MARFVFIILAVLQQLIFSNCMKRFLEETNEIQLEFQKLRSEMTGLQEKVLQLTSTNTALNNTVDDLKTRLIDLENYRTHRKSCETGSYTLSSLHPALKLPQTQTIHFHEAFQKAPVVTVGLAGLDIDAEHNMRINVEASAITPQGFNIVFTSWADTDVYVVKASWIACPKE